MAVDPKKCADFRALIRALKDTYHDGKVYPMAKHLGVALGTVQQWDNGMIRDPQPRTLRRLAEVYGLDFGDLINLAAPPEPKGKGRRMARAIRGGSGEILPPGVVQVVEFVSLMGRALTSWARPLLPTWCPA